MTKISDDVFLESWYRLNSPSKVSKELKIHVRAVHDRRRAIESRRGIVLHSEGGPKVPESDLVQFAIKHYAGRVSFEVQNGTIIIGSDPHYIPQERTVCHRALVKFCGELKPKLIVMNGDVLDAAIISRWPRMGWEKRYNVKDELEAIDERLTEIKDAVPQAKRCWTLGNHDARYELRLAAVAPEYEGIPGFTLKGHFPDWVPCWSTWINDGIVVKHRFKGGIHATHNNTLWSGKTIITGHLHSAKVTPFTDYDGTRYGVDAGTLAETFGSQFEGYMEDNPRSWRQAFVVLTIHKGKLLQPELAYKWDDTHVEFRGSLHEV